jgi:hypothetical protein
MALMALTDQRERLDADRRLTGALSSAPPRLGPRRSDAGGRHEHIPGPRTTHGDPHA